LTFDDGPDPTYTPKVEAELKSLGVHATFFLLGRNVTSHPSLAKELVDAGNWVGNHSYTHADLTTLSAAQVRDELMRANRAIEDATGIRPQFVRPPFSRWNDRTLSVFKELHLENVLWEISPADYETGRSVREIVAASVLVQNGGIIVLHDNNARTLEALPQIVDGLEKKGLCPGKLLTVREKIPSDVGYFSVKAVKP